MIVCLQSDIIPISATYSTPAPLLNMNWGLDLRRSLDHMEDSMLTTEQIKIIGHCVFFFRRQKPVHSSTLQVRLSHLELAMPPSNRKSKLPLEPTPLLLCASLAADLLPFLPGKVLLFSTESFTPTPPQSLLPRLPHWTRFLPPG